MTEVDEDGQIPAQSFLIDILLCEYQEAYATPTERNKRPKEEKKLQVKQIQGNRILAVK